MIGKAIMIVTVMLYNQGGLCNVAVCKSKTGELSFSGLDNRMRTYLINGIECTTSTSFLMLQLSQIDQVLCQGSLTIESYRDKKNILKYKEQTCFLITGKEFDPNLFDSRPFQCPVLAWVKTESIFPETVEFDNFGSNEGCRFNINYTYVSNSKPAIIKDCCTTSEPSATSRHNDDEEFNYWPAIIFLSILLTIQLAASLVLHHNAWVFKTTQNDQDHQKS